MAADLSLFEAAHLSEESAGFDGLERCYTPRALAAQLIDLTIELYGAPPEGQRAIEPSCGGGAFVEALQAQGIETVGVDVDAGARGLSLAWRSRTGDWASPKTRAAALRYAGLGRVWGVFGNPPFRHAELHVPGCMALGAEIVGLLLPLHMLESAKRVDWWHELQLGETRLASIHPLSERVPFSGYPAGYPRPLAWFVWRKGYAGLPMVDIVSMTGRRPLAVGGA